MSKSDQNNERVNASHNQQRNNPVEKLWDLNQAADFLGIRPDTLRKWCNEGKVPFIRIGNKKRFDPQRLRNWAIQKEVAPRPQYLRRRAS
jgi:excisionase family DNA binding protein